MPTPASPPLPCAPDVPATKPPLRTPPALPWSRKQPPETYLLWPSPHFLSALEVHQHSCFLHRDSQYGAGNFRWYGFLSFRASKPIGAKLSTQTARSRRPK